MRPETALVDQTEPHPWARVSLLAVGVLLELGIQPGRREVAISGFDDTLLARSLRLTSVRQPVTGRFSTA